MKTLNTVTLTALVLMCALLSACTENDRAKSFGGTMTVDLPAGTKLVNATWKQQQVWYLYRNAREGEKPETLTFHESSSFGLVEGTVVFQEH